MARRAAAAPFAVFDRALSASERAQRISARADRSADRVFSPALSPLYQSGTLVVGALVVMTVTGVYLLVFYDTDAPYASAVEMERQVFAGRWIRSLHRYAADLAIVATLVHLVRMFVQGRTWGPRLTAWLSGLVLLALLLLSGWTGMVLVWDVQGQLVAFEGAKLIDVLPFFSEPISRSFVSGEAAGRPFFFLNLVVHVALPIVIGIFLLAHTARLGRPQLLPPRALGLWTLAIFFALSVVVPVPLLEPANLLRLVGEAPLDGFYAFWIAVARLLSPGAHLAAWAFVWLLLASVPWWWRPRAEVATAPSFVDENLCTGCTQCYLDCPYEAITMLPRAVPKLSDVVAHVNASRCVSCGICAGSCAPMGVGPPGRTGREQLADIRAFVEEHPPDAGTIVAFACRNGVDRDEALVRTEGVLLRTIHCAGALHTSVVELLVRRGFGGVHVLACAERNCVYREGPKWLVERLFHEREAELHDRVDKHRVRVGFFGAGDAADAVAALEAFREEVRRIPGTGEEREVAIDTECEPPPEGTA